MPFRLNSSGKKPIAIGVELDEQTAGGTFDPDDVIGWYAQLGERGGH
jgi:hypothetical protein